MSNVTTAAQRASELPAAAVKQRRGISVVWAVPLVAAVIALFLAYTAYTSRGPQVTITFATAEGLQAGKTKVRYLDVDVGDVEAVAIAPDRRRVVVTARMTPEATTYLRDTTTFWVVKPRVGVGGVSGLGTLLSGAYIGIAPGEGDERKSFTGLKDPPLISANVAGREFVVTTATLGSLTQGSPVYYRGIEVGQVLGHTLNKASGSVEVALFIREPYTDLVRDATRFWNASGINVSAGAGGLDVEVGSLPALLTGGVSFDTPPDATSAAATPGARFPLFANERAANQARYTVKVPYLVFFDGSVGGLGPGAPVQFRGIRIGSVTDVRLEVDTTSDRIRIPVTLELEPQRLVSDEEVQHAADQRYRYMAELVKHGLRAQLKTGNLLTGELMVDLTFVPGATPAELDTQGPVAIIPSVPNALDQLQASVGQMLDRIAKLPVDDLVTSLTGTARKLDALVALPSVQEAVDSLGPSVAQFQRVLQRIDVEAGPILESVKRTSGDASAALREARTTMVSVRGTVGPQSELKDDTQDLLRELTRAAQSIRSFADYLDRHPEALVRGKGGRP